MSYSQAPPTYSAPKGYAAVPQSDAPAAASASASAATPLLASHDAAPRQEGDVDADDFKYGVSVEQSTPEVRQMFLKKVSPEFFWRGLAVSGGREGRQSGRMRGHTGGEEEMMEGPKVGGG